MSLPPRVQFSAFEASLLETTIAILEEDAAANIDGTHKSLKTNLIDVTGPSTREFLLIKALESRKENIKHTILYETLSLSIWTLNKYLMYDVSNVSNETIATVRDNILNPKGSNILLDYIKDKNGTPTTTKEGMPFSKCPTLLTDEIIKKCNELPEEWTVLQLCKYMNLKKFDQFSKAEHLTSNLPVSATLFSYPRSELLHQEACNVVLWPSKTINIFELYNMLSNMVKLLENRKTLLELDQTIEKSIQQFKEYLGPWVVLFCGKEKCLSGKNHMKKIYAQVDTFCDTFKLTTYQRILLSLVARRIDLLRKEYYIRAAQDISTNVDEYKNVLLFLHELKKKRSNSVFEYHPVILIIDETIDYVFWEMCNPVQEFCRINSLSMLIRLHNIYKSKIVKGYLRIKVKNGYSLINPDNNLPAMQKRMSDFHSDWTPHFKKTVATQEKLEDLLNYLAVADLFVYYGHGSGLQFLNASRLAETKLHCCAMLIGCESVAVKSKSIHAEMNGCHFFFHFASCPAVIGALYVITDGWADTISVEIITSWIPSKDKREVWLPSNDTKWPKNNASNVIERNPSISSIIAKVRCNLQMPLRMRIAIVHRGLPVYNELYK